MKFQRMYSKNNRPAFIAISLGFVLSASVSVFATAVSAGNTTYQYDSLGRVVKVTYPDTSRFVMPMMQQAIAPR